MQSCSHRRWRTLPSDQVLSEPAASAHWQRIRKRLCLQSALYLIVFGRCNNRIQNLWECGTTTKVVLDCQGLHGRSSWQPHSRHWGTWTQICISFLPTTSSGHHRIWINLLWSSIFPAQCWFPNFASRKALFGEPFLQVDRMLRVFY